MMPMMTMKRVWLLIAAVVTLSLQVGAFAPPVVHVATTSKSTATLNHPFASSPLSIRNDDPVRAAAVTTTTTSTLSSTALSASSSPSPEESSLPMANVLFGIGWIGLLIFTFGFAPGAFGADNDNAMLASILENPQSPDINPLFYAIFNLFVVATTNLASVGYPQVSEEDKVPFTPAVTLAAFIGYFALGPYMALRGPPTESIDSSTLGWATLNVFESKIFHAFMLVFCGLAIGPSVAPIVADPAGVVGDFVELVKTSRFGSVACADFSILTLLTAYFVKKDYELRQTDGDDSKALAVAASTLLLPGVGGALYCLTRPSLEE